MSPELEATDGERRRHNERFIAGTAHVRRLHLFRFRRVMASKIALGLRFNSERLDPEV